MARTAGKKQAPAKIEEEDEADGWEDAVVETDSKDGGADLRLRDWRDVERFREMRDLRRLVDDDYGLEEIFHVPLKPRGDNASRSSSKLVIPARAAPAPAPAKPAPSNARARNEGPPPKVAKAAAKPVKHPHPPKPVHKKPAHKVKAKAKRR